MHPTTSLVRKLLRCLSITVLLLFTALTCLPAARATEAAPTNTATLEQRVAALEAKAEAPHLDKGDNAWMMTSTALVLFMSLPGLALFYGGLVRRKNVLSIFAQVFAIAGITTLVWWAIGFSLSFAPGGNGFFGGAGWAFFKGVDGNPGTLPTVSQNVFAMFQLTFAIITPALIIGAIAERMKFAAVLLFVTIWLFVVYFPFAHMVWGGGYLATTIGALDFAGGTVVHMTSGFSALVLCLILGKRRGFGKEPQPPHSVVLSAIGTGILWVGWYGFNAGSAGAADGIAGNAFATTTFAAAVGGMSWGAAEWLIRGRPSVLGLCSGVVAGLVVITPAAGYVSVSSAVIIGVLAGLVPFLAVSYLKRALGYDDALDTFGVHGVGGTLGAILTGVLADPKVNSAVPAHGLLMAQLKAVVITIVWSVIATVIIAFVVKALVGLRASPEAETVGLDLSEHGEEGYID